MRRGMGRWRGALRVDGATRCRSMARRAAGRWRDALPVDAATCYASLAYGAYGVAAACMSLSCRADLLDLLLAGGGWPLGPRPLMLLRCRDIPVTAAPCRSPEPGAADKA